MAPSIKGALHRFRLFSAGVDSFSDRQSRTDSYYENAPLTRGELNSPVLGASPEALKNAMTSSENPLYELEGPKLRARVEQGRGHCHLIGNVYDEYLDKWLSKVLDPAEHKELQTVFNRLAEADEDLFRRLVSVSDYLETTARATLDEAIKKDWDGAHKRLADARRDVRPLRTAIGTAMVQLYSMKNDFIEMSGTAVA